jgi:hypothetical protein
VIWSPTFEERLRDWRDLREHATSADLETALLMINNWWWRAPIVNGTVWWRDFPDWPDPWDLIGQTSFCDLARALGMLYTVMMLPRSDIGTIELVETAEHNLVQIDQGKYILNWSPGTVVNIQSPEHAPLRSVSSTVFERLIR